MTRLIPLQGVPATDLLASNERLAHQSTAYPPAADSVAILRRRSRGRHMPGSDEYVNRIAIGGDRYVLSPDGTKLLLSCYRVRKDSVPAISDYPVYTGLAHVSRYLTIFAYCERRRNGNPGIRDTWVVGVHGLYTFTQIRNDGPWWTVLYANSVGRVYSAANGWFANNEQSAFAFMHSWLTEPSSQAPGTGGGSAGFGLYFTSGWVNGDLIEVPPTLTPRLDLFEDQTRIGDPHSLGFESGACAAYIAAVNGLPTCRGMNNVANLIQALQALKGAIDAFRGKVNFSGLGSGQELWLGYRYEYSTTKADLEEITSAVNRVRSLANAIDIRSHGVERRGDWTFRSSIFIDFKGFQGIQSTLERWGLALNAYDLWDMVPYSFIADWFLDIGGWLEFGNQLTLARSVSPDTCWNSVQTSFLNEFGCRELYYQRYYGVPSLSLAALSYRSSDPSGKTIIKRGLDLIALLL